MRLLVLNHESEFLNDLLNYLIKKKVAFDVRKPMEAIDKKYYDGIIASGGFLTKEKYKEILNWYNNFLNKLDKPFLGICLGLKIIGYCHGARMRKISFEEGITDIEFHKNFPLAPNAKNLKVYQSHGYELIPPLPSTLENFTGNETSPIQAIKVKKKQQFAVQFHPEKSNDGNVILDNFVSLCDKIEKKVM